MAIGKMLAAGNIYDKKEHTSKELKSIYQYENIEILESRF